MSKIKLILGALILLLSVQVNAALIDRVSYVTDTDSGLDWLKLENTYFQTYDDVVASMAVGGALEGWQYANSTQWENMLFGQGITPRQTCTDGSNFCGLVDGITNIEAIGLITLFGDWPDSLYPYPTSIGMLADTNPANINEHQVAHFFLDSIDYIPEIWVYTKGWFTVGDDHDHHEGYPQEGSWLVRPSVVPIPSAVWLFGSGLIGLIGFARRKA